MSISAAVWSRPREAIGCRPIPEFATESPLCLQPVEVFQLETPASAGPGAPVLPPAVGAAYRRRTAEWKQAHFTVRALCSQVDTESPGILSSGNLTYREPWCELIDVEGFAWNESSARSYYGLAAAN
jgi:hypothetical protein